jgi:hypothetical protein
MPKIREKFRAWFARKQPNTAKGKPSKRAGYEGSQTITTKQYLEKGQKDNETLQDPFFSERQEAVTTVQGPPYGRAQQAGTDLQAPATIDQYLDTKDQAPMPNNDPAILPPKLPSGEEGGLPLSKSTINAGKILGSLTPTSNGNSVVSSLSTKEYVMVSYANLLLGIMYPSNSSPEDCKPEYPQRTFNKCSLRRNQPI